MIPKHLITTWICDPDGDPYTPDHRALFAKCLSSWLRLMPDYALTVVTLGNLSDFGNVDDPWLNGILADRNYIGASQWARIRVLQQRGGVYVDMDVEAVRRFDELLSCGFVVGHIGCGQPFANNAVMASPPDHPFLAEQMRYVRRQNPKDPEFGNATGPFMVSNLLNARGWDGVDRDATVDGITVKASAAFHPYPYTSRFTPDCVTPDTIAIHHWGESWKPRAGLATVVADRQAVIGG